jgi:signal peptidase II
MGQVRDFIYLFYGKFSYPASNLADASISVAIAVFLFYEFLGKEKLSDLSFTNHILQIKLFGKGVCYD